MFIVKSSITIFTRESGFFAAFITKMLRYSLFRFIGFSAKIRTYESVRIHGMFDKREYFRRSWKHSKEIDEKCATSPYYYLVLYKREEIQGRVTRSLSSLKYIFKLTPLINSFHFNFRYHVPFKQSDGLKLENITKKGKIWNNKT